MNEGRRPAVHRFVSLLLRTRQGDEWKRQAQVNKVNRRYYLF